MNVNNMEIHPCFEDENVQARRAEGAAREQEIWTARKRKATLRFLVREILLVLGIFLSWVAMEANLVDWRLVFFITFLLMFCIGALFGEWRQFVTRKGGK